MQGQNIYFRFGGIKRDCSFREKRHDASQYTTNDVGIRCTLYCNTESSSLKKKKKKRADGQGWKMCKALRAFAAESRSPGSVGIQDMEQ